MRGKFAAQMLPCVLMSASDVTTACFVVLWSAWRCDVTSPLSPQMWISISTTSAKNLMMETNSRSASRCPRSQQLAKFALPSPVTWAGALTGRRCNVGSPGVTAKAFLMFGVVNTLTLKGTIGNGRIPNGKTSTTTRSPFRSRRDVDNTSTSVPGDSLLLSWAAS